MAKDVFAELREKAQKRVKDQLYADAGAVGGTTDLLRALGDDIAQQCGCTAIYCGAKSDARATEKVQRDYRKYVPEGDWYEMKDVVRMTIVARFPNQLKDVRKMIEKRCVAANSMGIIKAEERFAQTDPCGYSDLNFVVRLTNGRPAEIQANVPEVMYGKMSAKDFQDVLGTAKFNELKGRYRIEGGLGHGLYEIWQKGQASPKGTRAAMISKQYYKYLRGHYHPQVCQELTRELNGIVKANPGIFNH
jgi:hypothetical protein